MKKKDSSKCKEMESQGKQRGERGEGNVEEVEEEEEAASEVNKVKGKASETFATSQKKCRQLLSSDSQFCTFFFFFATLRAPCKVS